MAQTNQTVPGSKKFKSASQLLHSSWVFYQKHWKQIVPIVIAPTFLMYIAIILFSVTDMWSVVLGALFALASMLASLIAPQATIKAIHELSVNPNSKVDLIAQYKIGFTYTAQVIVLYVISFLVFVGSGFFLIIPAIIISVYSAMTLLALVIDDKDGLDAFTESYSIIHGRWFGVVWRSLFMGIICIIGYLGIEYICGALQILLGVTDKSISQSILSSIFGLVIVSIVSSLSSVYSYKLFMALKESRGTAHTHIFRAWIKCFAIIGFVLVICLPIILPGLRLS